MAESQPSIEFARALLALKLRTGRGYRELGNAIYISAATLHRYCAGKALPADFASVKRMARLAGVRAGELESLYHLWLRAQLDGRSSYRY